jgi:hypothetical protein
VYSVFISYSHADKAFARRVHDTLQGRGIRCLLAGGWTARLTAPSIKSSNYSSSAVARCTR